MLNRDVRWIGRAAAALLLACSASSALALDAAQWKFRQPLTVETAGIIKVALPPATLGAARNDLADVRLLDAAGTEIPFIIETPAPAVPVTPRAAASFRATLTDSATEILIETGRTDPIDFVQLRIPPTYFQTIDSSFIKAAKVEIVRPDGSWEFLHAGTPLFRQFGAIVEQLRIPLNGRRADRVRITVDDSHSTPQPFAAAEIVFSETKAPDETLPVEVRIRQRDEFTGETVLTLDLGAANVPLSSLEFQTPDPLFSRRLKFNVRELRGEEVRERTLVEGTIYRVSAEGLTSTSSLRVSADCVSPSSELLVHIANGDSPPISITGVIARQQPRWLIYRAAQPGSFVVLSGNAQVAAPHYDLASIAASLRAAPASSAKFGPLETTAVFRAATVPASFELPGAPIDVTAWTFRKPLTTRGDGLQELELDGEVLAHASADWRDLRIVQNGTQVPYVLERTDLARSQQLEVVRASDPKRPTQSRWILKLPTADLPLKGLTLRSTTPLFRRHFRVLSSITNERGPSESIMADFVWTRESTPGDSYNVALPETSTGSQLLLETDNGDNPPIILTNVTGTCRVVHLLFTPNSRDLGLYYGNANASAPNYDLSLVASQLLSADKARATLGAEEKTSAASWWSWKASGGSGGVLLWVALAATVGVLLVVIARLLPKPPEPPV